MATRRATKTTRGRVRTAAKASGSKVAAKSTKSRSGAKKSTKAKSGVAKKATKRKVARKSTKTRSNTRKSRG